MHVTYHVYSRFIYLPLAVSIVTSVAAQPPQRPTLLVTDGDGPPGMPVFATLAEAMEASADLHNPIILLGDGEHLLDEPVSQALELRSSALSPDAIAPLPQKNECGEIPEFSLVEPPCAFIRRTFPGPALKANFANPEDELVMRGVGLVGAPGAPMVEILSGHVNLINSHIGGRIDVRGEDASVSLLKTHVNSNNPGDIGGPELVPTNVGSYGLSFGTTECELALIFISGGASFYGWGLEIDKHPGIGICVDAGYANLCGGSIHDIHSLTNGTYGRGGVVRRGGKLILKQVDVYDVFEAGIAAVDGGSEAVLTRGCSVRNTRRSTATQIGVGILGQSGNQYTGVYLDGDGGTTTIDNTVLADNVAGRNSLQGNGIFAQGVCSALTLTNNTYDGNESAHVFLLRSNASLSGSSYTLLRRSHEDCCRPHRAPLDPALPDGRRPALTGSAHRTSTA